VIDAEGDTVWQKIGNAGEKGREELRNRPRLEKKPHTCEKIRVSEVKGGPKNKAECTRKPYPAMAVSRTKKAGEKKKEVSGPMLESSPFGESSILRSHHEGDQSGRKGKKGLGGGHVPGKSLILPNSEKKRTSSLQES